MTHQDKVLQLIEQLQITGVREDTEAGALVYTVEGTARFTASCVHTGHLLIVDEHGAPNTDGAVSAAIFHLIMRDQLGDTGPFATDKSPLSGYPPGWTLFAAYGKQAVPTPAQSAAV